MAKVLPAQALFRLTVLVHPSLRDVHTLLGFHPFCHAVWVAEVLKMSKIATKKTGGFFYKYKQSF